LALHDFRAQILVHLAPEAAFDFVADHRHVKQVLEGVTRWRPLGRSTGVGARFDVEMSLFSLPIGGILRIDTWDRPHRIGWVSESGPIEQRGGWRFTKHPDGVEIELAIAYRPPGGVVGDVLAGGLESRVRARLRQALERIRERLEA
jgi:ribosome-associated toxin RatA of RatAB toxin-antitoxin module